MQLVAYGAQDVYLTGNPQITFFKVVYRRHTNFSMECIEHTLSGNPDFGKKATVTITRNGDLAGAMYLKVVTQAATGFGSGNKVAWCKRLGHALIKSVELNIGGSRIDKQYGVWLDIWYELTHASGQARGYAKMVGDVPEMTTMATSLPEYTMYVPLQFWFCRNTGLALPLIALQYHEVRLHFEFTKASELVSYTTGSTLSSLKMKDASLLVDYVYLDSEERRRFAQVGHEYLIEQLQFTGEESARDRTHKYSLGFNHPHKELIFACRNGNYMGKTFLGQTIDEVAKAVVAAAVTGVASSPSAFPDKFVVDDFDMTSGVASYVEPGSVGSEANVWIDGVNLLSLVTSATVRVTGAYGSPTVEVLSVSHTITKAHLSTPLTDSGMEDGRTNGKPTVTVNQWNNFGLYLDGSGNPVANAGIQLNGHDRFDKREGAYFNYVVPNACHTNTPADGINVYSFALHPEQHQPSGTANLSRIDKTQLNVTFVSDAAADSIGFLNTDNKMYIFGVNYNVLRIMSGMGGLAYSS
jgi:hypothetical protein